MRRSPALAQVSTPSLEALRKYVAGDHAISFQGDFERGAALLQEAIALDTGFAMAERRLAIEMNNRGGKTARVQALIQRAYNHRDRLSDPERCWRSCATDCS